MTAPTPIPCEGGCGRYLRTPDSIRRRHGPVCWEKANPTRGRGHSLRARRLKPVTPATGQLTLFEETTTMTAIHQTAAEALRGPWHAYIAELDGFVYTSVDDLRENHQDEDGFSVVIVRATAMPNDRSGCRDRLPGSYTSADKALEIEDLFLDDEADDSESVEVQWARAQAMCAGLNAAAESASSATAPPLRPAVPPTAMHLPGPDGRCTISCNHGADTVYGGRA